jgi:hypothetical protein
LCNKGAGAGSQNGNLLLDLRDIVFAGLEVDLDGKWGSIGFAQSHLRWKDAYMFDCDDFSVGFINSFVDNAKATTW